MPFRNARSAFAVALIAAMGCGARAQSSACSDSFPGPALDTAWSFLDADGAPGGSARIENGKLALTGRGHDVYNAVNQFVGVRRAAGPGDFDVSVKIESQTNTHPWAQAGILAANDASDLSQGGYVIADVTPANGFHLFYDGGGTRGTLDAHADAGVSTYPVWIRLARTGAKFSAWYKTSATGAWTQIGKDVSAQGTAGPSQIALISLSHNDSADAKTVFDDFSCQGAATALFAPRHGPADAGDRGGFWPLGVRLDGRTPRSGRQAAYTVLMFTNSRIPKWDSSRP